MNTYLELLHLQWTSIPLNIPLEIRHELVEWEGRTNRPKLLTYLLPFRSVSRHPALTRNRFKVKQVLVSAAGILELT